MLTDVYNIAASGMAAASAQFAATANNVANADTPGYQPQRVDLVELSGGGVAVAGTATAGSSVDLASESVDMTRERTLYTANAQVIRTADSMMGSLLNVLDTDRDGDQR